MAPVAGRPFLEITLGQLARLGFHHVVLALGYKAKQISDHFGADFAGISLDYVVEESPLGTGGAARLALTCCSADHVFLFNGDTYLDLEADALEALWNRTRRPVIVARQVPDTARYGRLLTSGGRVIGFTEKGVEGPGLINAGCYVLGNGQLDKFPVDAPFSLESDYLVPAVRRDRVEVFVSDGLFIDIGVPEDLKRAQELLAHLR
jgi:D-glycero-alpha-D-manno-heptose 1-phosphate guanylyltransferase